MPTVLVLGTFDGLHPGHEDYFRQAREHGDRLVAVVARDRTVLEVKGQLPRMGEEARRASVEASPLVDSAILGRDGDKLAVICELKPEVIVLGYDQASFIGDLAEKLRARGLDCRVVRAEPFNPDVYKSSLLFGRSAEPPALASAVAEPEDRSLAEMEPVQDWLPL